MPNNASECLMINEVNVVRIIFEKLWAYSMAQNTHKLHLLFHAQYSFKKLRALDIIHTVLNINTQI